MLEVRAWGRSASPSNPRPCGDDTPSDPVARPSPQRSRRHGNVGRRARGQGVPGALLRPGRAHAALRPEPPVPSPGCPASRSQEVRPLSPTSARAIWGGRTRRARAARRDDGWGRAPRGVSPRDDGSREASDSATFLLGLKRGTGAVPQNPVAQDTPRLRRRRVPARVGVLGAGWSAPAREAPPTSRPETPEAPSLPPPRSGTPVADPCGRRPVPGGPGAASDPTLEDPALVRWTTRGKSHLPWRRAGPESRCRAPRACGL